jgi:hypothetical protein
VVGRRSWVVILGPALGDDGGLQPAHPAAALLDSIAMINYDVPRIDWKLADVEAEIAPGIIAIPDLW